MAASRRSHTKSSPKTPAKAHEKAAAAAARQGGGDEDDVPPGNGRPIWSGSISFGLLQIPVTVHSAEAKKELQFHQLDKRDLSPIGYLRINKTTGKKVEWNDIAKGYELEKGQFIVLSEADFKSANVEATQTIDIQDFVDAEQIHPSYYETPYYLAPTKKSNKAYAVLREALRRQKKAAVATFVMRSREHLCAVFAQEDALLLEILRFSHELRTTEHLALPKPGAADLKVHPKELEMAERLIEGMSTAWEPTKYRDQYRDDLLAKIEEKARTGKVTPAHEPKRPASEGNVIDIMSLLKKSVATAEKGRSAATRAGDGAAKGGGGTKKPRATRGGKAA